MLFENDTNIYTMRQANVAKALACKTLSSLSSEASKCIACSLHSIRKNIVFSSSLERKDLMLIGEAPGKNEDETGLPFTGRAGELLLRALKAVNLDYKDVYICNILKCRPPENREPTEEETIKCTPWLDQQIQLVQPKVIVTLGKHSSQYIFQSDSPMGKMRGNVIYIYGIPCIATWHPAFLLRREDKKEDFWTDLNKAILYINESNKQESNGPRTSTPSNIISK